MHTDKNSPFKIYNNDFERTLSFKNGDTRCDFAIIKSEHLEIAIFKDGQSEPTQNVIIPSIPGLMKNLGTFLTSAEEDAELKIDLA